MPSSPRAEVNPLALKWARESLGYTLEDAAPKVGVTAEKLDRAERGEHLLTLRQAENAAKAYDRPLAALFVPEPPREEPPEAQFRRLPGAPPPPWPHEMRLLIRRVRERQQAAVELYELLDDTPPWTEVVVPYADDPEELAGRVRALLGVPVDEQLGWRDQAGYRPLREWTDAVEALGVLVMQDGTVPVDTMRGFASTHEQVPAVVVNTQDDPRARAFSVVHEFGHLLRVRAGVQTGPYTEGWCDEFAGAVLMPRAEYARDFRAARRPDLLDQVDAVALSYGVTPYAAAVRANRMQLAPRQELDQVVARIRRRGAGARRGDEGGNYYRSQIARLGPAFIELVFSALDAQTLSHSVASGLLREKVNHLPTLREYLAARR